MTKFICGANEVENSSWDGRNIADAKNGLKQALNIPEDAKVLLNGNEVDAPQTIRTGDEIEWVKPGGTKGC